MGSQLPVCAYLAMGSNIGDRERYLQDAIECLDNHEHICVSGRSHIYETEPVGYVDQDAFLNMVIQVETQLSAQELFTVMLGVENKLGRIREIRFGPRTIDLDLLLYGDLQQEDPQLILPHPRMTERAFVLVPLVEVMQQKQSRQAGMWMEHLDQVEGKEGVKVWNHMQ